MIAGLGKEVNLLIPVGLVQFKKDAETVSQIQGIRAGRRLVAKVVQAEVLPVNAQPHRLAIRGALDPRPTGNFQRKVVAQKRRIHVIGQKDPLLRLTQGKEVLFLLKLDLIRLLDLVPGRIPTPLDLY